MLSPESHLRTILQPDPLAQAVRILRNTPESAIFDLGDLKVDGLGTFVAIVANAETDDAGWE